jgi:hypothetical protein
MATANGGGAGVSGSDGGGSDFNTQEAIATLVDRVNDQINYQDQAAAVQDAAQKILKVLQAIIEMLKTLRV